MTAPPGWATAIARVIFGFRVVGGLLMLAGVVLMLASDVRGPVVVLGGLGFLLLAVAAVADVLGRDPDGP